MQVCLAGLEDSGKRVFLSLLYGSMIRYSQEKKSGFRFNTSTNHQVVFGENFNNLRGGLWPYRPFPEKVTISMRFEEMGISSWFKKNVAKKQTTIKSTLEITTVDIERVNDDEIWEGITKSTKDLPGSKLTLMVFDYQSLKKDEESLSRFEGVFRKTIDWRGSKTTPVVLFTMCDRISSKKLEKMDAPQGIPEPKDIEKRKELGLTMIMEGIPSFHKLLKSYDPQFFFLGLKTEKDDDGKPVPKVTTDIENELEYPYDEYKALIDYIGKFDINK